MSHAVWIAVALAACAPVKPTAPHVATCDDAAERLGASLAANWEWRAAHREELSKERVDAQRAHLTRVVAVVCVRDRWAADVIQCHADAPLEVVANAGEGAVNTCAKKLTCEQHDAFIAAFRPFGKYESAQRCPDTPDR